MNLTVFKDKSEVMARHVHDSFAITPPIRDTYGSGSLNRVDVGSGDEGWVAAPVEIRAATSPDVLRSWRSVWKDRNEDTAYTTAWKRIQDKLQPHVDEHGNRFLCFKNSCSQQFVSHFNQWQDIVMNFHGDSDFKHLGLKETIERIKQV